MINILKVAFLFVSILFTVDTIPKIIHKISVPATNMVYWSLGLTGFIFLQFIL